MKIPLTFLFACLSLASCSTGESRPVVLEALPEYSIALADNIVFEIDPRIELLAGVQSRTSWVRESRGPSGAGSVYFDELSKFFEPYSDSRAVKESQALTNRGFAYDAPPGFAFSLEGGQAMRSPAEGWPEYLRNRAGRLGSGPKRLDSFARALGELYGESGFGAFLAAHEGDYRRWLTEASSGFDARAISSWLEGFYGRPGVQAVYHFVFAPAMFPGGGYGFSRIAGEGTERRLHVYQVVRAQGSQDREPGFPSGRNLAALGLHEFGHSFVNPALEAYSSDPRFAKGLASIFEPVAKEMRAQAYGQVPIFLNELVLRAACIVAERDIGLFSARDLEMELQSEMMKGFYPIRRVVALLEEYRSDRARYPDFNAFAPVLLGRLAAESEAIASEAPNDGAMSAGAGLPAVPGFVEGFEGAATELGVPAGFSLGIGAMSGGGDGTGTEVGIERDAAATGSSSLVFRGNARTSSWYFLSRPIAAKAGTLSLRYRARAEDVRKEGSQFGGSYLGFIVTESSGKARFVVKTVQGSFPWTDFELTTEIDPDKVRSIEFMAFLNESGTLAIDDVAVEYR